MFWLIAYALIGLGAFLGLAVADEDYRFDRTTPLGLLVTLVLWPAVLILIYILNRDDSEAFQ